MSEFISAYTYIKCYLEIKRNSWIICVLACVEISTRSAKENFILLTLINARMDEPTLHQDSRRNVSKQVFAALSNSPPEAPATTRYYRNSILNDDDDHGTELKRI